MAADALEDQLTATAKTTPLARGLMTIPGVGPLVALNFLALVDDPERFRRAADVGAYLGLTPRRHQSGEVDYTGRISRCGDAAMRGLLFEAAQSVIHRVKRSSRLKSWAMRLVARRGVKKATIAVARKLAVLMLTLWKTGAPFDANATV